MELAGMIYNAHHRVFPAAKLMLSTASLWPAAVALLKFLYVWMVLVQSDYYDGFWPNREREFEIEYIIKSNADAENIIKFSW